MRITKLVVVLLIFSLLFSVLVGCDTTNGTEHVCNFNEWITISEPKCKEKGLSQRFCSVCNYTETKYLDELGHDEISHEAQQASCGTKGWDAYVTCSRCDYSTYVSIPTNNHSYNEENVCKICSDCLDKGLNFTLSDDEENYILSQYSGNASHVIVPTQYKGKNVTSIGANAFLDCTSITTLTLPATLTCIASNAFKNCTNLKAVYTPSVSAWCNILFMPNEENILEDLESGWGLGTVDSNPMRYAEELYIGGELLVDLVIPQDVTEISPFALFSCESLTSVTFHEGVLSVGFNAFCHSDNISSLYITDLGAWFNIKFDYFPVMAAYYSIANPMRYANNIYLNGELITDLVIPDGVMYIPQDSFAKCESLKSVYIPNSVKSIAQGSFSAATNITSVIFENVTGWAVLRSMSWNAEEISESDLADPQKAAELFTDEYSGYSWSNNRE